MKPQPASVWTVMSPSDIRARFTSFGKYVISFAGFGELGYEDPEMLEATAKRVLSRWNPRDVLVNSGTLLRAQGQSGIADIFRIAKAMGIETAGIHPSIALRFQETHHVSPYCDHVHFVEDPTWGGFLEGTRQMSATLRTVLGVSDELIVIGGGKHAADELEAFVTHGKNPSYFPAEMNHAATKEWCGRSGAQIADFRGAAHQVWLNLGLTTDAEYPESSAAYPARSVTLRPSESPTPPSEPPPG